MGLTKFDLWKELEKRITERQSGATGFFPIADLRTGALNEQKGSSKKRSNGPHDWRHENYDRQGNNERVKKAQNVRTCARTWTIIIIIIEFARNVIKLTRD